MRLTANHASLADRCWLEIDLRAIRENARRFGALLGKHSMLMPAVKADAYGHGAIAAAGAALAGGAARLAVATVAEGVELRRGGITAPVHVLGPLLAGEAEPLIEHRLIASVYDAATVAGLGQAAECVGQDVRLHLKIDTGMGRHGCRPQAAAELGRQAMGLGRLAVEGVFTHLAQADDEAFTRFQLGLFDEACADLQGIMGRPLLRHAANSTAAILYPASHYEAVRPGLALYGIVDNPTATQRLPLEPALAWKTRVVQVKDYPAGHAIGYNRTYITPCPVRAALLAVGYADGYRRTFSNRADVLVHGQRCRVLGLVSMDCTVVDVSHAGAVAPGDEATLIGTDGPARVTVEELAALVPGTIPYEIITSFGGRNQWYFRSEETVVRAA